MRRGAYVGKKGDMGAPQVLIDGNAAVIHTNELDVSVVQQTLRAVLSHSCVVVMEWRLRQQPPAIETIRSGESSDFGIPAMSFKRQVVPPVSVQSLEDNALSAGRNVDVFQGLSCGWQQCYIC